MAKPVFQVLMNILVLTEHLPQVEKCSDPVSHLGKWRRVRIAHTSDDVITQFRDPHTPMIDFRHADK